MFLVDSCNMLIISVKGLTYLHCNLFHISAPTILQKIENCLAVEDVSESVLEQMLLCLKEEWMEYVDMITLIVLKHDIS